MNKTAIKAIVSSSMPLSVEDGYTARKRTVPGTFHIGVLSGNRLNSGTLRSQFIFFESESDWLNNDASAKMHCTLTRECLFKFKMMFGTSIAEVGMKPNQRRQFSCDIMCLAF